MVNDNMKFLRELNNYKQSEMIDFVGIAGSKWSDYERRKSTPSISDLLKIADFFRVDFREFVEKDLSKGKVYPISENKEKGKVLGKEKGKVYPENDTLSLVKDATLNREPKVVTVDTSGHDRAVLVPVRARAGYLAGYADPHYIEKLPSFDLPVFRGRMHRLFEVQGNSMNPTLHDKDIAICEYVENLSQIREDRVHVVVTRDSGVVIKRCLNRIEKAQVVVMKSDNWRERDQYPNLIAYPDEILEVWYVVGYISRQLPPPNEQYKKVNELEAQMTIVMDKLKKAGL